MRLWQIAAGDGSRDYAEVFLKFGAVLVGPGSEGEYFSHQSLYNNADSSEYRPFIQTLAEEVAIGDLVVLKRPSGKKWEIIAVGEVSSDYIYAEAFGDVDGWDLQHCRHVSWKRPKTTSIVEGLRRGALFAINHPQVIAEAKQIWESGIEVESQPLPQDPCEISVDQLIDSLMVEGLAGKNAELIASTIWRLRRIAKWYGSHGSDVSEYEIRTFLIVPLLTSLGWAEQKIKIEWKHIDVALFDTSYSEQSNPLVIIESKRLGDGLRYAPKQAIGYAKEYPTCDRFVVSDGIRYKLFMRDGEEWRYSAYMNLLAPKRTHPNLDGVQGAESFFLSLLPKGAI